MPCYDERGSGRTEYVRITPKEYRHNSDVAEILCSLCKVLVARGLIHLLDAAGAQWWKEHKRRDARRK
jgi:hypothetical protein